MTRVTGAADIALTDVELCTVVITTLATVIAASVVFNTNLFRENHNKYNKHERTHTAQVYDKWPCLIFKQRDMHPDELFLYFSFGKDKRKKMINCFLK